MGQRVSRASLLAGNSAQSALQRIAELLLSEDALRQLVAIDEITDDALAWAVAHGIVMYGAPMDKTQATTLPFTLLPTPFPADLYGQAMDMAAGFHTLMDKVACDMPWLQQVLEVTGKIDPICGPLLAICSKVYGQEGKDHALDIRLNMMRNDFMLDTASHQRAAYPLKQIELNMISVSFSTHAQDITEVHRYLLCKYLHRLDAMLTPELVGVALDHGLPASPNALGLAAAIADAHRAYGKRWPHAERNRVVLFIADQAESNELDHRKLEMALFKNHQIVSLRRSLTQVAAQRTSLLMPLAIHQNAGSMSPQALIIDDHEVTVAYFRSGYWPEQYNPAEACWETRELIERSEAVKCPSAPAQLAGMKKVQQVLCKPDQIGLFLPSRQAELLARTFAKMSDPTVASEDVRAALRDPSDWVLKPQIEGSGRLLFDAEISDALQSRSEAELAEFILMERIRPPITPSAIYNADNSGRAVPSVRSSVGELGIFGTLVADGRRQLRNDACGHLLRSKAHQTNQGGVFVGNAVVDAPLLLPSQVFWSRVL